MPSTPTYKNLDTLVEQPNSGTLEYSDRVVFTKIYRALFSVCQAAMLPKGSIGTGAMAGFIVATCALSKERGEMGLLTIRWEAGGGSDEGGQSLPADEVSVHPVELQPVIERLPKYASLSNQIIGSGDDAEPVMKVIDDVIRAATTSARKAALLKLLEELSLDDYALALDLLDKKEHGTAVYYLAGLEYSWTSYHWATPNIELGGTIESPGGPLAGYFDPGLGWLRKADAFDGSSGVFRLTRTWVGAPAGHFDDGIYSPAYIYPPP